MNPDDSNRVFYDQKGNKEYAKENGVELDPITSDELKAAERKVQYYGTTFTNTSRADAYVNLYLNGFTNDSNVYIGTLQPNLTFKGLSSSVHLANNNKTRIYFQWLNTASWSSENATNYIVYTTKSGDKGWYIIEDHIEEADADENPELNAKQKLILKKNISNTYYVDLPENTVEFFFATNGAINGGFNTSTYETSDSFFRTKSITNIHPETGYYLTGAVDDTTWNAEYKTFPVSGGISVKSAFDKLTINNGQHAYVSLVSGTNYTGTGASYAILDGSGLTVNANTGFVTATDFSVGSTANIKTTITGSLGDTMDIVTNVENPSTILAAPVALNVKVPVGTFEGDECTEPGKAEVVWYIENRGSADIKFDNIYITK